MKISERSLRELGDLVLGDYLGEGMSRKVYKYRLDDNYVIKIENYADTFQNVREWLIWQEVKYSEEYRQWFAPCSYISDSGTYLIMEYARPIVREELPELLPSFVTDIKLANFGMLKGKVVLVDYGVTLFNLNKRLKTISKDFIV
jgi:hypothetical protein